MATPNPQPRFSQDDGKKGETAFCSGVIWSLVMSSTEGHERIRSLPNFPLLSIISPKTSKSSAIETNPPPPDSKTGGCALRLSSNPSKTSSVPGLGLVQ